MVLCYLAYLLMRTAPASARAPLGGTDGATAARGDGEAP